MSRSLESISRAPSIAPGARTCTSSAGDLHQILGIVRTLHRGGTVKWLQRATGKSARACKYWLSGDYRPKGDDALAIARVLRAELAVFNTRLQQFELFPPAP